MRVKVRHETRYVYEAPVAYSIQRLYLTPASFASQKVVSWTIDALGFEGALSYLDGFGNRVHVVTASGLHDHVNVIAEGLVDCTDSAGIVRGLSCPTPLSVFLRQTHATLPDADIRALAQEGRSASLAALDQMHALMKLVHDRIAYEIGATDAHTTAAEAMAAGRGVCQDHAHALLSAARFLNFPARYVTGYLIIHNGEPATAAHAWAEVFLPDLGWVGFDAANCKCPTDEYVRVATGLDAQGVVPVRGSRRGGESERLIVEVTVQAEQ